MELIERFVTALVALAFCGAMVYGAAEWTIHQPSRRRKGWVFIICTLFGQILAVGGTWYTHQAFEQGWLGYLVVSEIIVITYMVGCLFNLSGRRGIMLICSMVVIALLIDIFRPNRLIEPHLEPLIERLLE